MPKNYRHIRIYDHETVKGLVQRKIGEKLGFSRGQVKELKKRHNKQKLGVGIPLTKSGRLPKDNGITKKRVCQLRYIFTGKDVKIKRLEMERLIWDFLSLK